LPISRFDPVLVETSLGFVIPRLRKRALGLQAPMHEPIGRGLLLGLAALGLLTRSAEIDEIAHVKARR
jgi:hypothetical protein